MNFSGSYHGADVTFLLKPLPLADFVDDVAEKERLIQSGQRLYSEMLSPERPPSARYVAVFDEACRANGERMARDCLRLAQLVAQRRSGPVTVVSLARGGTPVGVLLKRLLERVHDRVATHYSVSIVRDRGIGVLLIDHNVKLILDVCDRIHVLVEGRTLLEGTPAEVRASDALVEAYLGKSGSVHR